MFLVFLAGVGVLGVGIWPKASVKGAGSVSLSYLSSSPLLSEVDSFSVFFGGKWVHSNECVFFLNFPAKNHTLKISIKYPQIEYSFDLVFADNQRVIFKQKWMTKKTRVARVPNPNRWKEKISTR